MLLQCFFMFPKKQRITRELFPKYSDTKNTWNGIVLRVCFYKRKDPSTLFSVVVSKKQYKTIVSRNQFKRRVLSELQRFSHKTSFAGFDKYVIYPKVGVENILHKAIRADIYKFISECLN